MNMECSLATTWARESQDLEEDGGAGSRREGGRDMVMEEGSPGGGPGATRKSSEVVIIGLRGGVSCDEDECRDRSDTK